MNKDIELDKKKDIPRCKEHSLYLYHNGLTKNDEIIGTCKLGCVEFWKKEDWYKYTSHNYQNLPISTNLVDKKEKEE